MPTKLPVSQASLAQPTLNFSSPSKVGLPLALLGVGLLALASPGAAFAEAHARGSVVQTRVYKTVAVNQGEKVFDEVCKPEIGFLPKPMQAARQKLGPVKYPVRLTQIWYWSQDPHDKPVKVSGLIMEPQTGHDNPVVSYQHGTIYSALEAPSLFKDSLEAHTLYRTCAARGYTVLMPDYIGKGVAGFSPEPFLISKASSNTSQDLMTAYEQYSHKPIRQLFLAGYSQGGHSTASLQRDLEAQGKRKIDASAIMSGAFDLRRQFEAACSQDTLRAEGLIHLAPITSLMVNSWRHWYIPKVKSSMFFQKPYEKLPDLLDNPTPDVVKMVTACHAPLTRIFTREFVFEALRPGGITEAAVTANSPLFVAKSPTHIYHSRNDNLLSPAQSEELYTCMKAGGAKDVKLTIWNGPNHHDSVLDEMVMATKWFDTLAHFTP